MFRRGTLIIILQQGTKADTQTAEPIREWFWEPKATDDDMFTPERHLPKPSRYIIGAYSRVGGRGYVAGRTSDFTGGKLFWLPTPAARARTLKALRRRRSSTILDRRSWLERMSRRRK